MRVKTTSRRLAALGVALVLLAAGACGSDETEAGNGSTATTTLAESEASDALAAINDQTIVTLDELAALNLLALGVEPDVVLTSLSSDLWAELGPDLGIRSEPYSAAEPSIEYLASLQPDLLVGVGSPYVEEGRQAYEELAPLTVIPLGVPWQDQLEALATDLDLSEEGAEVVDRVEERVAEVSDGIAASGNGGESVSQLSVRAGNILAGTASGAAGAVMDQLGIERPAAQQVEAPQGLPFQPISEEVLTEHDADVVLVATGSVFDTDVLTSSPLYGELGAAQAGESYGVVGDVWLVGGSPFAAWWIVEDLGAVLAEGEAPATVADAGARWEQFTQG